MTSKGLVVVEQEEVLGPTPGPSSSTPDVRSPSRVSERTTNSAETRAAAAAAEREVKRSPIGELIYMRWLDGLRLKWPSIL